MTMPQPRGRLSLLTLTVGLIAALAIGAQAQSLTTTYTTNNGSTGNMFDVEAVVGLTIDRFDVNFDGTATIEVWALNTPGTFVGNQASNANWTLIQSVPSLLSNGADVPTPLPLLPTPFVMTAGSIQAFHVTTVSGSINYTNGTAQGALYSSNADMKIYEGNGGGYFSVTITPRIWSGTIHYTVNPTVADDLGVTTVSAPIDSVGCDSLTSMETITATIRNFGTNTVLNGSLVQVEYVVDGGLPVVEFAVLAADLNTSDTFNYSFTTPADLSSIGAHTVDVTVVHPGDLNAMNDTKSKTVNSGGAAVVNTFPWTETFENHATVVNSTVVPAGWTNDPTDGTGTYPDWRNEQATTGSLAGPTVDHTTGTVTGWYMYVEDSTGTDLSAINLITPCIDISGAVNPHLAFWHFSDAIIGSTNDNILEIDVLSYPGATTTMSVATFPSNGVGSDWTNHQVDLTPFLGTTIQIVFRGRNDNGTSFDDDVAIDDVSIYEPAPTPGQAPRPNQGVFDINNALNTNLANVASGQGGPYFSNVTQGAPFNMHFEGEPTQAIAVIYGALNPVSATYPGGIGQFDIGGPGVDMNGIPLNLGVFVNAIAWAQAGFPGFPLDALFFTNLSGTCDVPFTMPNFGIPSGQVLTSFQSAITASGAPFVYITNAIEVTVN